jgi:hypothetical protein
MWFKINVFKHKLAHLNISSWCCLWAFHQRQPKKKKQPPIKNLSTWNDENLQSRNRTWNFFYHFLNQTRVIKKLQTSFKQHPPKETFPKSNQNHEIFANNIQRTKKHNTISWIKLDNHENLKTSFNDQKTFKNPFMQSNKTKFFLSMKLIIQGTQKSHLLY